VTSSEFQARLRARAAEAGVTIPPEATARLEAYFRLLEKWNTRINLTAWPLDAPTDETFDRLLIEPMAAARFAAKAPEAWFDFGSGGGSPAIPFKIAQPEAKLTMVESKARKASFLREAVRALELTDTNVMNARFETISDIYLNRLDLITVRAVKSDRVLFGILHRFLASDGRAFLFHSTDTKPNVPDDLFSMVEVASLGRGSRLSILKPVFHVEQSR